MQLFYKNLDETFQISFLDFKVAKPLFSITVVLTNIWRNKNKKTKKDYKNRAFYRFFINSNAISTKNKLKYL